MPLISKIVALCSKAWARNPRSARAPPSTTAEKTYDPLRVPLRSSCGAPVHAPRTPYSVYIEQYVNGLGAYSKHLEETVVRERRQLVQAIAERERGCSVYQKYPLMVYVPVLVITTLFLQEFTNRSCAEHTHAALQQHAKEHSSLERVVI